ncbi:MAG: hypothetical protein AAF702_27110 [Chloroflexota bacterium]
MLKKKVNFTLIALIMVCSIFIIAHAMGSNTLVEGGVLPEQLAGIETSPNPTGP